MTDVLCVCQMCCDRCVCVCQACDDICYVCRVCYDRCVVCVPGVLWQMCCMCAKCVMTDVLCVADMWWQMCCMCRVCYDRCVVCVCQVCYDMCYVCVADTWLQMCCVCYDRCVVCVPGVLWQMCCVCGRRSSRSLRSERRAWRWCGRWRERWWRRRVRRHITSSPSSSTSPPSGNASPSWVNTDRSYSTRHCRMWVSPSLFSPRVLPHLPSFLASEATLCPVSSPHVSPTLSLPSAPSHPHLRSHKTPCSHPIPSHHHTLPLPSLHSSPQSLSSILVPCILSKIRMLGLIPIPPPPQHSLLSPFSLSTHMPNFLPFLPLVHFGKYPLILVSVNICCNWLHGSNVICSSVNVSHFTDCVYYKLVMNVSCARRKISTTRPIRSLSGSPGPSDSCDTRGRHQRTKWRSWSSFRNTKYDTRHSAFHNRTLCLPFSVNKVSPCGKHQPYYGKMGSLPVRV